MTPEEIREELNNLRRETLLLQTDLAEDSLKYRKRFADLKVRTKKLLKTLDRKELK